MMRHFVFTLWCYIYKKSSVNESDVLLSIANSKISGGEPYGYMNAKSGQHIAI